MIGKILGNRYELVEKIGGGGMSNVYKAKCKVLNRYVAVKILRQELTSDPLFVEKFKQESLSAASLTHPNIVSIYDTGFEDDIYYIVMEFVKGETLKHYIQKKGKLSEQETIRISKQIAEALKHAHVNKIVHRDIKPHNILLTEDRIVKVADFGIARATTSSTINNSSNVIGSVHYFSPEQARGGYVDEKSDIYSLGVVMYEMITGEVPFDADNHITVAMKQIQERAIPPSKKYPDLKISAALENIIMKCLEKHQSFRFQNIDEMLNLLNILNAKSGNVPLKEELIDSPTRIMPKLNPDMDNLNGDDAFDENKDKAFKAFFGENDQEDNEEQEESLEEKRKKRKTTIIAILCALIVAVIGGIISYNAIFHVSEITVPDLVGKQEDEAKKIVEDLGLEFKVAGEEFSNEFEEGQVIEQNVQEGMKIKENYPLEVIISKGKEDIKIPNLIGRYAIEAGVILKDAGLNEGNVTEEYSNTIPAGEIIKQYPDAGTPANMDDEVDYVVSLGEENKVAVMPNLIGLDLQSAKAKIINSGLTVGQVSEENSETTQVGVVMKQSVSSGVEIEQGTAIWITISSGPKEVPQDNPDTNNGTEKPTSGKFPLTIALPQDKDKVLVVVQKVTDGGIEIIYSKEVKTTEQSIIVNVEGKGTENFEIYIDNALYEKTQITFE
ncbi:MAG: pknB [Bacillota bacterium]|nr:pknB [Bacillota bacterium]